MALRVIGAWMVALVLAVGLGQQCYAALTKNPVALFEPRPKAPKPSGAPGVKKSDVIGVTVVSSKPEVLQSAPRKLKLYLSKKLTVTATRRADLSQAAYGGNTMWVGEVDGFKGSSSIVSLSTDGRSMYGLVRYVDKNKVHKFQVSPIKGGRMTAITEVKERNREEHKSISGKPA